MGKNKKTNIMATVFILVFALLFLIISGRFIYIQTTGEASNVALLDWANSKRGTSIALHAERGKIFDNNGMNLAYNRPTYRVYAILDPSYSKNQPEPKHVTDVKATAKALAPFLDMKENEITDMLKEGADKERFQVEFGKKGKNISQETMKEIRDKDIPGIYFIEDSIRYYPNGMFASHIIGFARADEEGAEISGVTGMEKEKNKLLSGTDGYVRYHRDKYNKKLLDAKEVVKEPEDGDDIYLTIDQKIQTLLEDTMSQVDEEYNPKRITAVIMNPKTGAIIAMSNRPSYNPNNPDQVENWYNDVISTPVEPGSTMKIFTWAAAINEGVYNGDETYHSGKYKINEKVAAVNDHNRGAGWGTISFDEGFRRSSNVAASKLVWEKIGSDKFLDYLKAFEFDKPTDIDLPNEVAGRISYDYPSDKLRASFGQSSTSTPIQQMKALTSIVNDGKMLQPYVIEKIVDPNTNEVLQENEPTTVGEPITKETADQVFELLDSVVNSDDGTGKKFQLDDYSVLGKTGTAQMPNPDGKGYLTGKENHVFSFIGMAPKDDPQLMMHVSITQPSLPDDEAGSDPVSFIFKNVVENGLHYLNIEPDKEKDVEKTEKLVFPDVIDLSTKEAKELLKKQKVDATVIGDGKKITDANMTAGMEFYQGQRVILITDQPKMPDISGWTQRDIVSLANRLEMKTDLSGSGFAVSQSIKAGEKVKKDMTLEVKLKPETPKSEKKKKKK